MEKDKRPGHGRQVSTSTLNRAINALKFYYAIVLREYFIYDIKRPKKDKKPPVVLNKEEVTKIISTPSNVKHKPYINAYLLGGFKGEWSGKT